MSDRSQPVEFNKNELVVALKATDLVINMLNGLKIEAVRRDTDEALELALVEFTGLDNWTTPPDYKPSGYQPSGNVEQDKYDQLVEYLRQQFRNSCAGWTPELAKNRHVSCVGGAGPANGVVSGGVASCAGGEPVPVGSAAYSIDPNNAGEHCRIAILDTRLADRPELLGEVLASSDSYLPANGTAPLDYYEGHATFVTGLIVKAAPAAELRLEAVLTGEGSTCTAWDLAKAMAKLVDSEIDVLNLSLGCFTADGLPPFVLQRAVELLWPHTVIVAAAGNHGDPRSGGCIDGKPRPFWPAALDTVIAVGAADGAKTAEFSPKAVWVDLEAPGVNVTSLYLSGPVDGEREADRAGNYTGAKTHIANFGGYARWRGTSAATATVTGIIAAAMKPGKTAAQVVRDMRNGRVDGVRPSHP